MANSDIKVKDFEFMSSNTYYTIHGKMWIPKHDVIAVVQISHGMAEHIDRYDEFARFLAKRNILVVGNDHMGHGKSINTKDDLGYFSIPVKGLAKNLRERYSGSGLAVRDLHKVTRMVKKHYPGVPYILFGHSMGSFLARRYMMEYGNELDSAILMGTGNQPKSEVALGLALCSITALLKGDRYRSTLFNKVMFGNYNRKIKNNTSCNAWITSDNDRLKMYEEDELCGFTFTMNGLKALFSTIRYIENPKNIEKIPVDMKLLLLSGAEDPVGDYGKQVKQVYGDYTKHGVKDISVRIYNGCRHELLNEKIRDVVYEDIYDWLDKHVINPRKDKGWDSEPYM